jgi:hypothetical protein
MLNTMGPSDLAELLRWVKAKFTDFTPDTVLGAVTSGPTTGLSINSILRDGKVLLVKLPEADGRQLGDPDKAAAAILEALDADPVPLRLALGSDVVDALLGHIDSVRSELLQWERVSRDTGFVNS